MNVRGTIAHVDGNTIDISQRTVGIAKIHLETCENRGGPKESLSIPSGKLYWHPPPKTRRQLQNGRHTAAYRSPYFPESMRGPAKEPARGILLHRAA